MKLEDLRHSCATYGIADLEDVTLLSHGALFKGTYYINLLKGQSWCFVARERRGGGIRIKRVSQQRVEA